jgi:hypothetical protein
VFTTISQDEDADRQLALYLTRLIFGSQNLGSEEKIQEALGPVTQWLSDRGYECARAAFTAFFSYYDRGGWLAMDLKYLQEHDPAVVADQLLALFHPPQLISILSALLGYSDGTSTFIGLLRAGELLSRWSLFDPNYVLVEPALFYFESRAANSEKFAGTDISAAIDSTLRILTEPSSPPPATPALVAS